MSLREKISGIADSVKDFFAGGINGLFARLFPWRKSRKRTQRSSKTSRKSSKARREREKVTGRINGFWAKLFPWRERRKARRDQKKVIKEVEEWLSILEMRVSRQREEQVNLDWYTLKSSQPGRISVSLFTPYRMGELITLNKLWSRRVQQNRMRR